MLATLLAGALLQAAAASPPPASEPAFLAQDAKQAGTVVLPGLQYRVLRSGPSSGLHPRRSDLIVVRYVGRFVDGRVFNTSAMGGEGTTTFPLQTLIPGWIAALQRMRPGDVWELTVPANLGYGEAGKSYIPPDSTLLFRVELVAACAASPSTDSAPHC